MKLLLLNAGLLSEMTLILIFVLTPYIVIGLTAILEAIFDRHKSPATMPDPKKTQEIRSAIAVFSGVLLLSYFLPWMEFYYADGYSSIQKQLGFIDIISMFTTGDFDETSFVAVVITVLLTLLSIATILSCFLKNRTMYRWFASSSFQLMPLIFSVITVGIVQSEEAASDAMSATIKYGTLLAFFICALILITILIDIIIHAKKCKWQILFYVSILMFVLFSIIIYELADVLDNMDISPLFAFAFLIIPVTVIVYFIAKLWRREEENVAVLHTVSPTGDISSGESPSNHSLDKTSITSDTTESETKPSDHSRYMPSASSRLANRMREFAPEQTKPQVQSESLLPPAAPVPEKKEMTASKKSGNVFFTAAKICGLTGAGLLILSIVNLSNAVDSYGVVDYSKENAAYNVFVVAVILIGIGGISSLTGIIKKMID